MRVFLQLRPFVWFCQFFGIIPFYMVIDDSPAKTFEKFSFSLRHPVTWWFSFLFISLIVLPVLDIQVVWQIIPHTDDAPTHVPPIFLGFILQEHVFSFILLASARYMICKHACIRRAVSLVQKVNNELMVEDMPSEYIPAVRKHVIAAILSPLIASISVMVSNPTIFNSKVQTAGLAFAVLNVISRCIMIVMVMGSFLLSYLCYYIVSCYIRLIMSNLERLQRLSEVEMLVEMVSETRKTAWIPMSYTRKQKLKNSKRMFGYLCEALVELNQAFSFPVLIFLTLRLISSAFSLYVAISGLLNANNLILRALVPSFATISIIGLFGILIVFRAADLPIIQMRELRERIFSILNEEKDLDMDMELEVIFFLLIPTCAYKAVAFLQDISEERVRLSAAGLFSVGMNVVPSVKLF
ncbi:hypothetical protein DAPPUDRAFT_116535 [Daphnia pulex]|uniref:Gustatory receptor n=1 Tax=Daphnia pulex TaxID=6669 RepID=E9HPP8_DAPPU|nr:hypothetical protein DAPPUDRAFT_116535 [Daphnia pulex]|eukprot:EFX66300.1 hypothetical protein DAPPUDRAFT_116535 [Daphnia pulex]